MTTETNATNSAVARSRMKLANVVRGRLSKPLRLCVYGLDGVGKSTFASQAPLPIFLGAEDGTATLDVPRFPEPQTWREALAACDELETTQHDFRTFVIDTLDWLEPLCWAHIVANTRGADGKTYDSIGDIPYGNGYNAALDQWRVLLARLDRLRSLRGMSSILLAHAWIRKFSNPAGDDFDRYEMKLHAKTAGLIREWSDGVLFATNELHTYKGTSDKRARAKGIMTKARVLYTTRTAAYDAKNRHNLPESIPLDYESFEDALIAGLPEPLETTRNRIAAMLAPLSDADPLRDRVARAVTAAGDNGQQLAKIANRLAATITTKEQSEAT